jgi:hypothetical protein
VSKNLVPKPDPADKVENAEEASSKKDFEQKQREAAAAQNLPEGAVPEVRPIASQTVDDQALHSKVFRELRDSGDDRGGAPAMPKSAYDKAASQDQLTKSRRESRMPRLHVGARGYVDNPGSPDDGRAISIVRIAGYGSPEAEMIATMGNPESRFAEPTEYECTTRDGRAETLLVDAKHFRTMERSEDWGRTPIH